MRRTLVILGLLACAYVEYQFYPGHSYLHGESQVLVPMIERLQFPGLLSRDLVATHPTLRYTAYDEATLALGRIAHLNIAGAMAAQQFGARLAFVTGIFLLASAASLSYSASFVIAVLTGFGAALPGLNLVTIDREPVPYAIALGLAIFSLGLAATHRVLLAGLLAGIAFVYSPAIALPLWLCLTVSVWCVPSLRSALRPLLTILVIAVLLLGNLVQLQPGAPSSTPLFDMVSAQWVGLVRQRAPSALVGDWAGKQIWLYLGIVIAALCALYRLRERLKPITRWLLLLSLVGGMIAIPGTALVQLFVPWAFWMYFEPARALLAAVTVSMALCGMAAAYALRRHRGEAFLWMAAFCGLLLTPLLTRQQPTGAALSNTAMASLASWAQQNTWGGSLFFFAGEHDRFDPGRFRALSLRPVYVDWPGGDLTRCFEDFAIEWSTRWQEAGGQDDAIAQIRRLLPQPIDYYVLPVGQELSRVRPVFADREIGVYDARDLRGIL